MLLTTGLYSVVDNNVMGIYLDLKKTHDTVNQNILLYKLYNYGAIEMQCKCSERTLMYRITSIISVCVVNNVKYS